MPTALTPSRVPPTRDLIEFFSAPLDRAELSGVRLAEAGVQMSAATVGAWQSEWHAAPFVFTRLVPSWNADTPAGSSLHVYVQTRRAVGGETKWWDFGVWAYGDGDVRRASVDGQGDADGDVDTDTLSANVPMTEYRFRITLARTAAATATPTLRMAAAVVSDPGSLRTTIPSAPGPGVGKDLDVPSYSQEIHAGEYPEYDSGGEAWCSPTSTAMILAFWKTGPTADETSWVDPGYPDPRVDHAARYTFDATYGGTGNWPFNTGYAAHYGLRAFVTRLRSLTEAERFIAAGIPLVASVTVAAGALPGFLLPQGSSGHVLVIRGFTANGDVISNDPAATSDAAVRRVYPRAAFERAWLGGSQGTVYVIRPASVPLPPRVEGASANW